MASAAEEQVAQFVQMKEEFKEMKATVMKLAEENRVLHGEIQQYRTHGGSGSQGEKGSGGKANYDDKVHRDVNLETFDGKERWKFTKWDKRLRAILRGRGFQFVKDTLDWSKNFKGNPETNPQNIISNAIYAEQAREHNVSEWMGDGGKEHEALNRVLYSMLNLYVDGAAETSIVNAEEGNGIDSYRRLCSQYNPKSARQAAKYMEDLLKIVPAKKPSQIWDKLEEIDDLARKYRENHTSQKEVDQDLMMVVLWKVITPEAESYLKLQLRDNAELDYPTLKANITTWLQTATEGKVGMDLSAVERGKKDKEPPAKEWPAEDWASGQWSDWAPGGADLSYWGADTAWANPASLPTHTPEELLALQKGKGKGKGKTWNKGKGKGAKGGCAICGEMDHWKNECPYNYNNKGRGKDKGKGKGKGKRKSKGKGHPAYHVDQHWGTTEANWSDPSAAWNPPTLGDWGQEQGQNLHVPFMGCLERKVDPICESCKHDAK